MISGLRTPASSLYPGSQQAARLREPAESDQSKRFSSTGACMHLLWPEKAVDAKAPTCLEKNTTRGARAGRSPICPLPSKRGCPAVTAAALFPVVPLPSRHSPLLRPQRSVRSEFHADFAKRPRRLRLRRPASDRVPSPQLVDQLGQLFLRLLPAHPYRLTARQLRVFLGVPRRKTLPFGCL